MDLNSCDILASEEKFTDRISFAGAGNIAWHLGHAFREKGCIIDRVISPSGERGAELAELLDADYSDSLEIPSGTCDILVLAVNDAALGTVIQQLSCPDILVVHTAGSIPMEVLLNKFTRCGVLYPFQTLTRGVPCDLSGVPVCIEASEEKSLSVLERLARLISREVRIMNSAERKKLHLAGVILNNFTNHLILRSQEYLEKNQLDGKLLNPLLQETINKLEKTGAAEAQTGPARRNDSNVINNHLQLLSDEPDLKILYSTISDSIIAYYSKT